MKRWKKEEYEVWLETAVYLIAIVCGLAFIGFIIGVMLLFAK